MTLYILESGLSQASETTRKFFNKTRFFFVRKNLVENTIEFINATFPEDVLTTSSIKDFKQSDNGYMKITTQNSIINVTPFVVGCFNLQPYHVEDIIDHCSFIETEEVPYETYYLNHKMVIEGKEDLIFISENNSYGVTNINDVEGWGDWTTRLLKDKEGYLYLESWFDFESEDTNKHTHSFKKTNIKIG